MLKSMTGYGRAEGICGDYKVLAEIKSVNHRFSDYTIKVPKNLMFLEERLRKAASRQITRGKVDIYITVENLGQSDKEINLNEEYARQYIDALKSLRDTFGLRDDISVMEVAKNPEVFLTERKEEDKEAVWEAVDAKFEIALADFTAMRAREGARIGEDLRGRIQYMKTLAERIDERSPETVAEYQKKLEDKIRELLQTRDIDDARLLTEVAIFADKVAVNEEIVRLSSHFEEFDNVLSDDLPAGRRLDFLVQEINREVNTIGSKANDMEIAKLVVELKAEIEKLREQIQNIE